MREEFDEVEYAKNLEDHEIQEMVFDGVVETVDGCSVEPDGECPHGFRSPLIILGLI